MKVYCSKCPAALIDEEGADCQIDENQRELNKSGRYGCSRRSIEKIKSDLDKHFEEEGKEWEEFVLKS